MRGGKREGAGRKGLKTKVMRIPIELESQVLELINHYKNKPFDSVTQSIEPIKPKYPVLNDEELKAFREWLIKLNFVKSKTEARKITDSPKLCRNTFIKYIGYSDEWQNNDILNLIELYSVD